jgi:zinc transport system substrate-binding protein
VARVLDADLVVYLHGFQPAVDEAVDQASADRRFDAADEGADLDLRFTPIEEGTEHADEAGSLDPHFWLDPLRLSNVGAALAARLGELAPEHRDAFTARAEALAERLVALDGTFEQGLADCARRDLVTSHNAFGYLARRYDLTQVGITGLTPEEEASPADLAAVTDHVREHDVRTIFFESLVSPAIAETIAAETGADTDVLDPLEGLDDSSKGRDYLEVMAANLTSLRTGLDCR